jgi:hypothetical protein
MDNIGFPQKVVFVDRLVLRGKRDQREVFDVLFEGRLIFSFLPISTFTYIRRNPEVIRYLIDKVFYILYTFYSCYYDGKHVRIETPAQIKMILLQ